MARLKHITDYDIQALVDNELDWEDEKRVRRYISKNEKAAKRFENLKSQKQLLHNLFFQQKCN